MDIIKKRFQCQKCKNLLQSPVLLPCGHSTCQYHTINTKRPILCEKCGIEHTTPVNGAFPLNIDLNELIEAKIACLDFGNEYKEAKQSCEKFDEILIKCEQILNDPFNFIYHAIDFLKETVQLKGEEMILNISENMTKIISKLDQHKNECENELNGNEFKMKSKKLIDEKEKARIDLDKWQETLNEIKLNEQEWKRIKIESEKAIEKFENKLIEFKIDLLPKKFDEFSEEIEESFGKFNIDPTFKLKPKKDILDSIILLNDMKEDLINLCGFDSSQKFELLYRGSLHGFSASDFHSKCDNNPKTLTIIKDTSGNIFGGYTEATWDGDGYKSDKNAFIFSLVNKQRMPVKLNVTNGNCAIYCNMRYGPTFGVGHDICIRDKMTANFSYSSFGFSYKVENYLGGSEKAKCFLADGGHNFTVEEIEVIKLK